MEVFSTRSQDRPNPVGIHRVRIVELVPAVALETRLRLRPGQPEPRIGAKPQYHLMRGARVSAVHDSDGAPSIGVRQGGR